jgi:hypothetical protein
MIRAVYIDQVITRQISHLGRPFLVVTRLDVALCNIDSRTLGSTFIELAVAKQARNYLVFSLKLGASSVVEMLFLRIKVFGDDVGNIADVPGSSNGALRLAACARNSELRSLSRGLSCHDSLC